MISEKQAHDLKLFLWAELPLEMVRQLPHDVASEINKIIDKATLAETEELLACQRKQNQN